MAAGRSEANASAFSAAELEFIAEDEMIQIRSNRTILDLDLICGNYGPIIAAIGCEVPLWLAVALKKRGICSIEPPEWMSVEKLTKVLEAERDTDKFQELPFHYVEISKLLFEHAREDINDAYMVRLLIEDIKDVRFHKVGTGLEIISREHTMALKLKNLSAMEANIVRPFVTRALGTVHKLSSPDMIPDADGSSSTQPRTVNRGPRRQLKDR